MSLAKRWEHPCAKDVPSPPVLGAMSCVSPVLCRTIPKKAVGACGGQGWLHPGARGGHGAHGAALRSQLQLQREFCSSGSPVHPHSWTSSLVAASPGLISHPPARRSSPKLRQALARTYYSAACRCLAGAGQSLAVGSVSGAVWGAPVPEEGVCRAPRAGRSPAHGSGARIPGRKRSAQRTRSILIPSRVFWGARQSPAVQS